MLFFRSMGRFLLLERSGPYCCVLLPGNRRGILLPAWEQSPKLCACRLCGVSSIASGSRKRLRRRLYFGSGKMEERPGDGTDFSGRDFPECGLGAAARVRAPASARRRGKGGEAIPQGCETLYRQASKYAGFRLFVPSHGRLGKEPILRCFMRFPLSLPSFPCAQCIVLYPSEYRPGSLVFSPSAGAVHGLTAF